jgi:hypothetical protein
MLTMFVQSSGTLLLDSRRLPAASAGAMSGDDGASDAACCIVCGCPRGPCAQPAEAAQERQSGCPFELTGATSPDRLSRSMPQPLSIAMASLLLVVGFIYLAV